MLLIAKILSERAGAGPVAGLGQTLDYVPQLCNRLLHDCETLSLRKRCGCCQYCRDNRHRIRLKGSTANHFILSDNLPTTMALVRGKITA